MWTRGRLARSMIRRLSRATSYCRLRTDCRSSRSWQGKATIHIHQSKTTALSMKKSKVWNMFKIVPKLWGTFYHIPSNSIPHLTCQRIEPLRGTKIVGTTIGTTISLHGTSQAQVRPIWVSTTPTSLLPHSLWLPVTRRNPRTVTM